MIKATENLRSSRAFRRSLRHFRRSFGTPGRSFLGHSQQPPSHQIQVRQRARHEQSMRVLFQSSIPRRREAEDALDDQERMFDLGPDTRLRRVLRPFDLIDLALTPAPAVGHVLRVRRAVFDHFALTLVGRVTPDLGLFTVQQIGQAGRIVDVRRGRGDGMDEFGPAVDTNVRLHPEEPLVALLRLVHVRITGLVLVLRRRRCADDRGVDNSALAHFDTVRLEIFKDVLEQSLAEIVPFKQVPETADRSLGNCSCVALPPASMQSSSGAGLSERSRPTKRRIATES